MKNQNRSLFLLALVAAAAAAGVILAAGCSSVQGFKATTDGNLGPEEAARAAIVARAEAEALEQIAASQYEQRERFVGFAKQASHTLGAPEIVSGLVGALGGLFLPSPIKRKREKTNDASA
jgi:hypothetical protein